MSAEGEASEPEAPPIRVLLVDDQELVRAGLRGILRAQFGFEIVGECADGGEVIAAVENVAAPTSCSWMCGCRYSTGSPPPSACSRRTGRRRCWR